MIYSIKASQEGLGIVDQARRKKRWNKTAEVWCSQAFISRATLSRFWGMQSIRSELFMAICEAVGVDWELVAEQHDSQENMLQTRDGLSTTPVNVRVEGSNSLTPSSSPGSNQISESGNHQDWGDAPETTIFYGRMNELNTLKQWIVQNNCRLVGLTGMRGIGKTTLAAKFARSHQDEFEFVIWRSLRNPPRLELFLAELIQFLSGQQAIEVSATLDGKILQLLKHLSTHRCLLIFDGVESVLQTGSGRFCTEWYREGYEEYSQLFTQLGETHHNSCLVLTSGNMPKELSHLEGEALPVRCLQLHGLSQPEGQQVAETKGRLTGSEMEWSALINAYAGNPLILKIVASAIRDLFGGNIGAYLALLQNSPFILDEVREILEEQFYRLNPLEQDLLCWLAINQNSMALEELQEGLTYPISTCALMQAIATLQRCALIDIAIEKNYVKPTFNDTIQQSVIPKFTTNQLIKQMGWNSFRQRHNRLQNQLELHHNTETRTARNNRKDSGNTSDIKPVTAMSMLISA